MRGSHQGNRCVPRESGTKISIIIPISQAERKNTHLCTSLQIIHITAHIRIIFLNQRVISIRLIVHKWENNQRTTPFRRFGKSIHARTFKNHVFRSSCRHGTVGMLRICHILHNLRSISCQIIVV